MILRFCMPTIGKNDHLFICFIKLILSNIRNGLLICSIMTYSCLFTPCNYN